MMMMIQVIASPVYMILILPFKLKQNAASFMQSTGSIFSTGAISDQLGTTELDPECVTSLFDGAIDSDSLATDYPDISQELAVLLSCCQKKPSTKCFNWDFGTHKFCQLFNKTHKSNTYGPSGLHISH